MQATGEIVELLPPLGGLHRGLGYTKKPLGYSESMRNVRAYDVVEKRGRIGSRPGLAKAFQTQLGLLDSGTDGTTNASPGTTFDDAGGQDWTTLGIVVGVDTLEVISATTGTITPGIYAITAVAAGSITLASSPGVSCSGITYKVGNASIRMASAIRTLNNIGVSLFADDFNGAALDGAQWSAIGGLLALPSVGSGLAYADNANTDLQGGVLAGIADISTVAYRKATMAINNLLTDTTTATNEWTLHLDTRATSALFSEGVYMKLIYQHASAGNTLSFNIYINGVLAAMEHAHAIVSGTRGWGGVDQTFPTQGVMELSIDPNNIITARFSTNHNHFPYSQMVWDANVDVDPVDAYVPVGTLAAFTLKSAVGIPDTSAQSLAVSYVSTTGESPPEAAIFSANHSLYRETISGTMSKVTGSNVNLTISDRFFAANRLDKLYIADYEIYRKSLVGVVNGTSLTDAGVADWTTYGLDADGDVVEILSAGTAAGGGGVAVVGVYGIGSVAVGAITLASNAGGTTTGSVYYRVLRYAKIYDTSLNTLTRFGLGTILYSQLPPGCKSVRLWQDRLVWCNNKEVPQGWWMSAAGYPLLYDYGDSGTIGADGTTSDPLAPLGIGAAVAGSNSEYAGLIGEPLVDTIPLNDDVLILACKTSYYYLTGNPILGGVINNITREIGLSGVDTWCRTTDGRLITLTPDGLYEISVGGAVSLSRDVLPVELQGLTDDRYDITLTYDVVRRGINITATLKELESGAGGVAAEALVGIYYFYDLRTGGFFPETHERIHDPITAITYQPSGISTPLSLWACRDGYVRQFADAASTDDGTEYDTDCYYGPIPLGAGNYGDGILHELVCVLDVNAGDVTVEIHVGYSAQSALVAVPRYTTTMSAGRNRNRYPRLRGGYAYIVVRGTAGSAWSMESITITRERVSALAVV